MLYCCEKYKNREEIDKFVADFTLGVVPDKEFYKDKEGAVFVNQ